MYQWVIVRYLMKEKNSRLKREGEPRLFKNVAYWYYPMPQQMAQIYAYIGSTNWSQDFCFCFVFEDIDL